SRRPFASGTASTAVPTDSRSGSPPRASSSGRRRRRYRPSDTPAAGWSSGLATRKRPTPSRPWRRSGSGGTRRSAETGDPRAPPMSFLCDTSVLFAASDGGHVHHRASLELVATATPEHSFVAAHSLAELYATLSGVPGPRMRRLDQVLQAVEH